MPLRLSGMQKLILQTVQRQEGLSQVRIAALLDASYLTVHRHIARMVGMGVLRLERHGMGTRCYLANGSAEGTGRGNGNA